MNYRKRLHEGFSLVEVIIVIAIMAILVGVIVLAVIPNVQRSRESKDLTKLDTIASCTNIALANHQINSDGWFEIGGTTPTGDTKVVYDAIVEEMGDISDIEMESSAAIGSGSIRVGWKFNNSVPHIVVQIGNGTVLCRYTMGTPGDSSSGLRYFIIEIGSGDDPFM